MEVDDNNSTAPTMDDIVSDDNGQSGATKMDDEVERIRRIEDQLASLKLSVQDSAKATEVSQHRPLYVKTTRRIERFRGHPKATGDLTVDDWISDIKGQISIQRLDEADQVDFIIDHLAGTARQEVLARGLDDPESIYKVLSRLFGDGQSLTQLQQRFYSYTQKEDDVLTCSLQLVSLYDKICQIEPSFTTGKESALKGRLAEALNDEALKREIRRLNLECPELSYFDVRDRAVTWMGTPDPGAKIRKATNQEAVHSSMFQDILEALKRQEAQIQKQQDQINSLVSVLPKRENNYDKDKRKRSCYICSSPDHLRRNCPYLSMIQKDSAKSNATKESSSPLN